MAGDVVAQRVPQHLGFAALRVRRDVAGRDLAQHQSHGQQSALRRGQRRGQGLRALGQQIGQVIGEGGLARAGVPQQHDLRHLILAQRLQQRGPVLALAPHQPHRPRAAVSGAFFRRCHHVQVHVDVGQRHVVPVRGRALAGAQELLVDHAQRQAAALRGQAAVVGGEQVVGRLFAGVGDVLVAADEVAALGVNGAFDPRTTLGGCLPLPEFGQFLFEGGNPGLN